MLSTARMRSKRAADIPLLQSAGCDGSNVANGAPYALAHGARGARAHSPPLIQFIVSKNGVDLHAVDLISNAACVATTNTPMNTSAVRPPDPYPD